MTDSAVLFISLIIGLGCGITAGFTAFVITRNEYQKHQFGRRRLLRVSLQAARTAFALFPASAIVPGYLLTRFVL